MGPIERGLEPEFTLHRLWLEGDKREYLRRIGPRIRGVVAYTSAIPADAGLIAALPALEIIANMGVGYDSIDLESCKARGIVVTNAGSVNAVDVAEHAMALILDVARAVSAGDRYIRGGTWPTGGRMKLTNRLAGRRLGIVGLGNIGRELATRAEAFGLPVAYHNRRRRTDVPYPYVESVAQLAEQSDILVVATPGSPDTHHLIDRAVLDALGPKGILVNIARGWVVDEAALILALEEGRLGGAGLDVFEAEPDVPARLLALPNVVVTPHQGGATYEGVGASIEVVIGNLRAHFAGKPVLYRVG
jgi:lactate dehydrogenase-like 2-hydroxyacid dehydrogenase